MVSPMTNSSLGCKRCGEWVLPQHGIGVHDVMTRREGLEQDQVHKHKHHVTRNSHSFEKNITRQFRVLTRVFGHVCGRLLRSRGKWRLRV